MLELWQRSALVALVLLASPAPDLGIEARSGQASDTIEAGAQGPALVAHHQLVGAPSIEARASELAPRLAARPWVSLVPAPILATSVHHALARARRAFTRPRVRRFRPAGPDDF